MRRSTLTAVFLLMVVLAIAPAAFSQPPAIAPGTASPLELGQLVYSPDSPGAPAGSVWVVADDREVPIAPGTSVEVEEPQKLEVWHGGPVEATDGILLAVPSFNQNDPAWKDTLMQSCNLAIGPQGCALTATAMVFKYYGATNKNPAQLNTCLGHSACPIVWGTAANNCSENKATWVNTWAFSYTKLQSMLTADRPPIVKLTNGSNTHFVVVTLGSGAIASNYQIIDPWDGMSKLLSAYTSNGWTLDSIREFARR